ncbi:MAG: hypothetical protein ICV68_07215, partial [Pyrinomonadaceae bacterium]|nr:hypothetical protein [Pyrinomonadaceae bacterium]
MFPRIILLLILFSVVAVCARAQQAAFEEKGYIYDFSTPEKTTETRNSFVNAAADGDWPIVKLYLD